jgi:hypothetical protein
MQSCVAQVQAACACAHGTYTTVAGGGGSCVCDAGWLGANCDQADHPYCPCEQFSGWLSGAYATCQIYASGAMILYASDNYQVYGDTCSSGGSSVSGLTAGELQACKDQMLAADAATSNLCAACADVDCGAASCISGLGYGVSCYY